MLRTSLAAVFLMLASTSPVPARAQEVDAALPVAPLPPYPAIAPLVLDAPLIVDASIRRVSRLRAADAAGVADGDTRFFIDADIVALIKGSDALPDRISYVVDLANDATGRAPRVARRRVLLFARPVPSDPALVQLIRRGAELDWTPGTERRVRGIATEAAAADAAPAITGVAAAVHSAGTLPGTGQTQIFLTTADHRSVSLTIDRAADQPPRWSVALGEIVDQGAPPPARDTLLWFRLACSLPRALPDASISGDTPDDATAAQADYQVVIDALGSCPSPG